MFKKYFKVTTIYLSIILVFFLIISLIIRMRPLDIPIDTSDNTKVSLKKIILVPGEYTMALAIDIKHKSTYTYLNKIFGELDGQIAKYHIKWSIENKQDVFSGWKNSSSRRNGWSSNKEYAVGLSVVNLVSGYNEINVEIINGLSGLSDLSTKLVLDPGSGAKSTQSPFTDLILLISAIMLYCLLPIVVLLWIIYFAKIGG